MNNYIFPKWAWIGRFNLICYIKQINCCIYLYVCVECVILGLISLIHNFKRGKQMDNIKEQMLWDEIEMIWEDGGNQDDTLYVDVDTMTIKKSKSCCYFIAMLNERAERCAKNKEYALIKSKGNNEY
tara:strand:+ start:913 stop:1293 length:381 start_codon:yes stop_codon:yes gene_type:complete